MESRTKFSAAYSLQEKVYVFCDVMYKMENFINVLHKPGASLSSQDPPRWQVIDVPQDVMSYRRWVSFAPLNSTEIAILGGRDQDEFFGDVITFNTSTYEFKIEDVEGALTFVNSSN